MRKDAPKGGRPASPEREAALAAGSLRYSTGVPCLNGHVAERYVSTRMCVDCLNERNAGLRQDRLFAARAWRDANRERMSDYRRENRAALTAAEVRRYATKMQATPSWFEREVVEAVYAVAAAWRSAGFECNVDHMVPLQSKKVSGLHCLSNLNVMPKVANVTKGNRVWPDMAEMA